MTGGARRPLRQSQVKPNEISIDFRAGAVHTILGENGSGKSTLVKLLSGVAFQDAGALTLDGAPFSGRTPANFAARGFATVFQEVLIAPDRDVTENMLLGQNGLFRWAIARRDRKRVVAEVLRRISRAAIPLDARAGDLPLALQQIVVIARALARTPRILILDEAPAGRRLFALGGNPLAARYALIKPIAMWTTTFVLSAWFAALAGVLLLGFTGSAYGDVGQPDLFQTLAAVVVGGTSLLGGRGSYVGTLVGAAVLTEINTLLIGLGLRRRWCKPPSAPSSSRSYRSMAASRTYVPLSRSRPCRRR